MGIGVGWSEVEETNEKLGVDGWVIEVWGLSSLSHSSSNSPFLTQIFSTDYSYRPLDPSDPPLHPPEDAALVSTVQNSYHSGIIWTRYLGSGSLWVHRGLVLLRCHGGGGGLTVICSFCKYQCCCPCNHGFIIIYLPIYVRRIPNCTQVFPPQIQLSPQ